MVVFVVLVTARLTIKFNVAIESQPLMLVRLAVYVPAALMVWPFQVNGNWFVQMAVLVVLVSVGLTIRIKVAIESQPLMLVRLSVYVPAAFIAWPFQVYGSWFVQMAVFVVLVNVGLTVNINVAMESQPLAVIRLAV